MNKVVISCRGRALVLVERWSIRFADERNRYFNQFVSSSPVEAATRCSPCVGHQALHRLWIPYLSTIPGNFGEGDRPPSTLEGFKSYKAGGSYLKRISCRLSLITAAILQYAPVKKRSLTVWWILQHSRQQWKDPFVSASVVSEVFRGVLVRKGRIIDRTLHSTHFPLIRSG